MSLLSPGLYDELVKWRWGVASWRLRFKVVLGFFILGTACYGLSQFVVIPRLNDTIAGLNGALEKKDEEIASLRHENQKLYATNLHLQEMVAPLERKARELYPNLESSAAIAELARSINVVRELATRNEFRAVNDDLRRRLENSLKDLVATSPNSQLRVIIRGREGDTNRQLLADGLVKILQAAGISAEVGRFTVPIGVQEPMLIYCSPEETLLAETLVKALGPALRNPKVSGKPRSIQKPGEFEIYLNGIPEFSPDGSVLLR